MMEDTASGALLRSTSTIEAKNAAAQPTTAPEPRPGALVAVALTSSDATPAAPAVNAVAGGSEADRVVAFLGLMKGRAKKMAERKNYPLHSQPC